MKTNLKTPISYYGGKQSMLKFILPLIPEHTVYCEPFFGGGAVFWAKESVKMEVINDFNGLVVNFYEQLKANFDELKKVIDATPYSRQSYQKAMVVYHNPYLFTPIVKAWAFWVGTNFGFSHQIGSFRSSGLTGKELNICMNKKERITPETAIRLEGVLIENKDAVDVIQRYDSAETFHYIDPPYVGAEQGHYGGYTQEYFDKLLNALCAVKGKFILSSYPNSRLSECIADMSWNSNDQNLHHHCKMTSNLKKVECLTMNF